jgi:hypothetical protein
VATGKKLSDAYVELHADDSALGPEVKVKATRVGKEFGSALQRQLKTLRIDPIDIKASPKDALAAIETTRVRLKALSRDAPTVELRLRAEKALTDLDRFAKRLGTDPALKPEIEPVPKLNRPAFVRRLDTLLGSLDIHPVEIDADPKKALEGIELTKKRLDALSRDAATVEIRVHSEHALQEIESLKRRMTRSGTVAAEGFAGRFTQKLGSLLESMPISGPLAAGIGVGIAAIAPLVGAGIAGALIGGVGVGGVIGGLVLAAKDPRVVTAASAVGNRIKARLLLGAGAFVQPTIDGIEDIDRALNNVDLEGMLRRASRFVPILTSGVSSAIASMGGGLEDVIRSAEPVIRAFSHSIAQIGEAVGGGFTLLAQDADEGASALDDLTTAVTKTIDVAFGLIHALAVVKGAFDSVDDGIDSFRYRLEDALSIGDVAGAQFDITADGLSNMERRSRQAAGSLEGVTLQAHVAGQSVVQYSGGVKIAADNEEELKKKSEALKAVQDALKASQDGLSQTLDHLGGKTSSATLRADALKTAMDNLYGATIRNTDANEEYQAAWDDLSASVKNNKRSLDSHSAAGRANRDVLEGLLTKSGELYISNINAGQSIDSARRKHEARTEAIRKESARLHLNKDETERLIKTYGRIPGKKTTDLILDGVKEIVGALWRLYVYQRALAEGRTIESMETVLRKGNDNGPSKGGGYAYGGQVPGWSPHSRADNIPASVDGENGVRLTAREWVHPVDAVDYYGPKFMEAVQKRRLPKEIGQLSGYASGGTVAPVDTSRTIPFHTDVSHTHLMTRAQAAAKVAAQIGGSFGHWPSSPGAQRGDSGVWRRIVALIKSSGTNQGSFGNAYRAGDPLWHGSGRAVDWMGFNLDRLARFFLGRQGQILEMIHRSNTRDYAYTRGRNKGSFNEALMQAHRNHLHIAMNRGGQVPVAKVGMADTGRTVLERGWNLIGNNTGAREHLSTETVDMTETNALLRILIEATTGVAPGLAAAMATSGRRTLQMSRALGVPTIVGAP